MNPGTSIGGRRITKKAKMCLLYVTNNSDQQQEKQKQHLKFNIYIIILSFDIENFCVWTKKMMKQTIAPDFISFEISFSGSINTHKHRLKISECMNRKKGIVFSVGKEFFERRKTIFESTHTNTSMVSFKKTNFPSFSLLCILLHFTYFLLSFFHIPFYPSLHFSFMLRPTISTK